MRRGMEHVGSLLGDFLKDSGLDRGISQWRPVVAWRDLVGDEIAAHAEAFRFARGVLWVTVPNSVWMQHITYLKPEIMRILRRECPGARVTDIRCVIGERRAAPHPMGE